MTSRKSTFKKMIVGATTTVIFVAFVFLFTEWQRLCGRHFLHDSLNSKVELPSLTSGPAPFCESCALIGTAGTLLNLSLGAEIDRFQCVVRLGFSPVLGMEKDLGSKTTIRIVDAFRFYPFLKRPEKLLSAKYKSRHWYLFDKGPGDEIKYRKFFIDFMDTHGQTSLRLFTREEEKEMAQFLKKFGGKTQYSLWNGRPAALSFSIKVIEEAVCPDLVVYGIPDPKICKKNLNIGIRSKYWDQKSPFLCQNGEDASSTESTHHLTAVSEVASLLERRALKFWASVRKGVNFKQPSWPSRKDLHVEKTLQ